MKIMIDKASILSNTYESLLPLFPRRSSTANKSDFGCAVIIGGSRHYVGAPKFAVCAAERVGAFFNGETDRNVLGQAAFITAQGKAGMLVGAGTSVLCVPDFLLDSVYVFDVLSAVYGIKTEAGYIVFDADELKAILRPRGAVAIGMGIGKTDISPFVSYIFENTALNVVIDADGLGTACFDDYKGRAVLTPHIGEFSKMTGITVDDIKSNPAELCREYARKHNCVLVLKDSVSYISDGKCVYENRTGNVKLAVGGSGDVLSGTVCGLLAQGFSPLNAARAGSFLLGKSAELSLVNEYSHLPTDTVLGISTALSEFTN